MQTKYKIDRETRRMLIAYVRKYDDYKKWYLTERDRIIEPSRKQIIGMPYYQNDNSPTLLAAEKLEELENHPKAQALKAIDQAKFILCCNILNEDERNKIRRAIWLSCLDGGAYNFDAFAGGIACERRSFYRYKNEFLNTIKSLLSL
jgi:hypothetical protein